MKERISHEELLRVIGYDQFSALRQSASEERHPGACADTMDDIIKDGYDRAAALRRLRNDFEDIMSGVCRRRTIEINPEDFIKKMHFTDPFNQSNSPNGTL